MRFRFHSTSQERRPVRLTDVLAKLSDEEMNALVHRVGLRPDSRKRLSPRDQLARGIVGLPEVRDPGRLPAASRQLLYCVAEAGGVYDVPALPDAVLPLSSRGLIFARKAERGMQLLLPTALLLSLPVYEDEDRNGIRALLAQSSEEVWLQLALHFTGSSGVSPVVLGLERVWTEMSTASGIATTVDDLGAAERELLVKLEARGGEVDTEELLELEREPLRLRTALGARTTRRGPSYALERRGLLFPVAPHRHVVPTQVMHVAGRDGIVARQARRVSVQNTVLAVDHTPKRARFAKDPAVLSLALASSSPRRARGFRPGWGTPRSWVQKWAKVFGRSREEVQLIAALSRAVGLWREEALAVDAGPGSSTLLELRERLFRSWLRGGAWDEAFVDGELLRLKAEQRRSSGVALVREILLDALSELADDRWVVWSSIAAYAQTDDRARAAERLLERWSARLGTEAPGLGWVFRRILLVSLPALGVLDLGDGETADQALRVTPFGRRCLREEAEAPDCGGQSRFFDDGRLCVGSNQRVADVLALWAFAEPGRVERVLEVVTSRESLSRAVASGCEPATVVAALERFGKPPRAILDSLADVSRVRGRGELVSAAGFVWIADPAVRTTLSDDRRTRNCFVTPSPEAGLLVATGVTETMLKLRCRQIGIELVSADGGLRATDARATDRVLEEGSSHVTQAPAQGRKAS